MDPVTSAAVAAVVTRYVLPAIKSLGEQVLEKSGDAASDAAVGFGKRLLQMVLGRRGPAGRSRPDVAVLEQGIERRVLAIARDPGQPNTPVQLAGAIEDLLEADRELLASVVELLRQAPVGPPQQGAGAVDVDGDVTAPIITNSSVGSVISNSTVNLGPDPDELARKHFAAGRRHLDLGDYSAAVEDFRLARSYDAENPDAYFLGAVAMLGGQMAFRASLGCIREIERLIQSAIKLEDRAVFHYFLAYVRYDYYERKSLRPPASWQASFMDACGRHLTQAQIDSLFRWLSVENPLPSPR